MAEFLRVVAILLEVLVLAGIVYSMLWGVKLLLTEFGVGQKYSRAIMMALTVVFSLVVLFFIAHLTAFYPVYPET